MEQELTVEWLFEMGNDTRRSLIKGSSLEERLVDLELEQVLEMYKLEQVLGMYKPEQILGMYKPEQVLGMYKPEERVEGLKPEQIIGAYKPEEKRVLLEALQRSLEMDEASE